MQHFIYYVVDSYCLGTYDVTVTSYVTTCPYFLINYLPHHLFCLEMCDVTTYVTPIVGSLSKEGVQNIPSPNTSKRLT